LGCFLAYFGIINTFLLWLILDLLAFLLDIVVEILQIPPDLPFFPSQKNTIPHPSCHSETPLFVILNAVKNPSLNLLSVASQPLYLCFVHFAWVLRLSRCGVPLLIGVPQRNSPMYRFAKNRCGEASKTSPPKINLLKLAHSLPHRLFPSDMDQVGVVDKPIYHRISNSTFPELRMPTCR